MEEIYIKQYAYIFLHVPFFMPMKIVISWILPLEACALQPVHQGGEQQEYCDGDEQNGQGDQALHLGGQVTDKIIYQDSGKHCHKHTETKSILNNILKN